MRIKLVYGSDTGNTENVIDNYLLSIFEPYFDIETLSVSQISPDDWTSHDFYILSIPTWYDGELQSDWEDYFEEFKTIDFTGRSHIMAFNTERCV